MKKPDSYNIIKPDFNRIFIFNYLDFLVRNNKDSRFCDLGCGDFYLGKYQNVDGYELELPHKFYHKPKIYDGKRVPVRDSYYDYIISNNVIEHVHDKEGHIKEMKRIMKKDGIIIMFMPTSLFYTARILSVSYWHHKAQTKGKNKIHGLPGIYKRILDEIKSWTYDYYSLLFRRMGLKTVYYECFGNILSLERRFNTLNSLLNNFRLKKGVQHFFILKK